MVPQVSVAAQVSAAAQLGVAAQPQVRMAAPRSGWRCGQGGGAGWGVGVPGQVNRHGRSKPGTAWLQSRRGLLHDVRT